MKKTFFTIWSIILFIILSSCQKTSNDSLLGDNKTFDYYSFVKAAKRSASDNLLNTKKIINKTVFLSSHNVNNKGVFYYSGVTPASKKIARSYRSNSSTLEGISPNDNLSLDLSSYGLMSNNQLEIITPFINGIIQQSNDFGEIQNLITNFDVTVSQSNILTNEEKQLLGQFSAELQVFLNFYINNQNHLFVSEFGNGKYVMYLDHSQLNSSLNCKVDMKNVMRGAVIQFFIYGIDGAMVGGVHGAVLGAAGGFVGGALHGLANELLWSCFKKNTSISLIPEEDIVITFENEETLPNEILFPEEYLGEYYFTLSPALINNPIPSPKYSSYVYYFNSKYYYNPEKTCLLPDGYYFSNDDNNYYYVINGEIQSVDVKPSFLPGNLHPIVEFYLNPFNCNN